MIRNKESFRERFRHEFGNAPLVALLAGISAPLMLPSVRLPGTTSMPADTKADHIALSSPFAIEACTAASKLASPEMLTITCDQPWVS
jgi:hypothetical protein